MAAQALQKTSSGIDGLDELTRGGLPKGRPSLICGSAGCGKTMFGLQFLVNGILEHDEPGVLMVFEETAEELAANVASVGWDLEGLEEQGKLVLDSVYFEPSEIQQTGSFSLDGLFIRLEAAVTEIGAKRVVLDTLEVLFAGLDSGALRAELRRLFRWLKQRGLTAVITAERGQGTFTRHGMEEYVSDCVIMLDHRVERQISTRRLRVVKYRGTAHDADETPFLIEHDGIKVMPISSLTLEHQVSDERVSSGVERLDTMLDGKGYYRGASVLITGTPGAGKTTISSSFLAAGCARGERCMIFALEESPAQIIRNMKSVGIDLQPHVDSGLLRMTSTRPSSRGLEEHLAVLLHEVNAFDPRLVVVDPISAFTTAPDEREAMLTRLVDLLKARGVTALMTSLTGLIDEANTLGISSVIDTWLQLEVLEFEGERNRGMSIIKARGTNHSKQVREYLITEDGITLVDVYSGAGRVLMGSARRNHEAQELAIRTQRQRELASKRHRIEHRRTEVESQMAAMQAALDAELETLELELAGAETASEQLEEDMTTMAARRGADHHG